MFYKKAVLKNFAVFTRKQRDISIPVNIAKFLRTVTLKNIRERLLLYITHISEQLIFREAIFQNSLSNIFISNFNFTFVSLNTFISLNNFISYMDNHTNEKSCINVHYDKENNSQKFRKFLLIYAFI